MTRIFTFSLIVILVLGCQPSEKQAGIQAQGNSELASHNNESTNTEMMNEQIQLIETWLKSNAPNLADLFNPPASADEIAAFEQKHKLVFPPTLKQLYLIHDGEKQESDGIFGCWKLMPLEMVEQEIELMEHDQKIPILRSGGGDSYYVKSFNEQNPDLKLYECWHEQPDEETVIANSLLEFLNEFNGKLSNGQFVLDPDTDNPLKALVDKDEL